MAGEQTTQTTPGAPPTRIRIARVGPVIDGGRHAVKRTPGDRVVVSADVLRDGHEVLRAVVRYREPGGNRWREAPLRPIDAEKQGVRWAGEFVLGDRLGVWHWQIEAWVDRFATWRGELARRIDGAEPDLGPELAEGARIVRAAAEDLPEAARARAFIVATALEEPGAPPELGLDPDLAGLLAAHPHRAERTRGDELRVQVDATLARFGSWYELFPRSWGGLAGVRRRIPALAELGFDVLYMPPIHPIGVTNRKGPNNALTAGPGDPGSPYAIGGREGGHTAIHPDLGTPADFEALVRTADEHGMAVALDLAIQCSADHPWLTEHPEWFHRRPDGTLRYAENPPKKYQDIYNVDFGCADWQGLWNALLGVVRTWIDLGVRVFRVDNPHTKPLPFWEWLLAEIRSTDPDVVFLAEAFTRREMMRALAKVGFQQSYTYFTWKDSRWDLTEYFSELASAATVWEPEAGESDSFRPNAFVNTPDILPPYLQAGGPRAFPVRLILAATLSPSYGIYSGFESYEHHAVAPGSEEYVDSEKYEIRQRSLDGPLLPMVKVLNRARRDNPALQHLPGLRFLETHNDALVAYARRHEENVVITVVNIDVEHPQEGLVEIPHDLGTPHEFTVTDLLTVDRHDWRVGGNFVRLDPARQAGHVLRVDTP